MGQLPQRLPTLIACLGRQLPVLLQPWQQGDQEYGHTTAIDTTPIKARGGVWHSKDKQAGIAPSTAIDTEAGWSRSQYHGWWWGYKLHLLVTAAPHWLPLGADLTPANVGDNTHARRLLQGPLQDLPGEVRIMLGDQLYNDKQLRTLWSQPAAIKAASSIPIPMAALTCAASCTPCAHRRLNLSTPSSRRSLTASRKRLPEASSATSC